MSVELVLKNKFGSFYVTSEGWHINGQKDKFIASVKRQLKSKYHNRQVEAEIVINFIKNKIEI